MIVLWNVVKKRSRLIVPVIVLLLITSATINAETASFVDYGEANLVDIVQDESIDPIDPIDPIDNPIDISDEESGEDDAPADSSDLVNPLREINIFIMEKSAFNVKSIDRELVALERELLQLRKKAAEERNNISIEIYMKYLELNSENMVLHDFEETYFKGNESEYEEQINSYYRSKEQDFVDLIQKYQDAIVQYSNALNVPLKSVEKNLLSEQLDQSVNSPTGEDIQISRSILTDEEVISIIVTVYHVLEDQLNIESITEDANDDQLTAAEEIVFQEEYKDIYSGENLIFNLKRNPSIIGGYYLIELEYSDPEIPTEYLRYEALAMSSTSNSNETINVNQSIDVSLGAGVYQVYEFTAAQTKSHRVFTGPYGGIGGTNDTVLEIYSDAALTHLVASNDDYNGTVFSSITFVPNAGQTYYIKLRTYSSSGSLNCRITLLLLEPIVFTETSAEYVYNTSGSLLMIYFGSGKQIYYLYDNNGNLLRKILLN